MTYRPCWLLTLIWDPESLHFGEPPLEREEVRISSMHASKVFLQNPLVLRGIVLHYCFVSYSVIRYAWHISDDKGSGTEWEKIGEAERKCSLQNVACFRFGLKNTHGPFGSTKSPSIASEFRFHITLLFTRVLALFPSPLLAITPIDCWLATVHYHPLGLHRL